MGFFFPTNGMLQNSILFSFVFSILCLNSKRTVCIMKLKPWFICYTDFLRTLCLLIKNEIENGEVVCTFEEGPATDVVDGDTNWHAKKLGECIAIETWREKPSLQFALKLTSMKTTSNSILTSLSLVIRSVSPVVVKTVITFGRL